MDQVTAGDVVVSSAAPARKPRANVSWKEFLRIAIVERATFSTVDSAANALGMSKASFQQKMSAARKKYPKVFEGVPHYKGDVGGGPKVPTEAELIGMVESLKPVPKAD